MREVGIMRGRGKVLLALVVTCWGVLMVVMMSANGPTDLSKEFPGSVSGGGKHRRRRLFHTAVTSSDSVYNTWQCRVMYYWFKKHSFQMGGFTRILHSSHPDAFMQEIPTFLASPLPQSLTMVPIFIYSFTNN